MTQYNIQINDFIGKTFSKIHQEEQEIRFYVANSHTFYVMKHNQDCCECVYLEDVSGDLYDLIGVPILMAEEATSRDRQTFQPPEMCSDYYTWTFYKLATSKGYVTLRWFGSSNGYYSEGVEIDKFTSELDDET